MKVFHGSYAKIDQIDVSKGELLRDFGRAFYVTRFREQAEFWAKRKGKSKKTNGIVTEFTFFESAFVSDYFKVLRFFDYSEEWLDFVINNRKNDTVSNMHNYDIVEGPVADDAISTQIDVYLAGGISKEEFIKDLHFKHHVSHQIAFCTAKSLLMIESPFEKIDLSEMTIDDAITQSLVVDFNYSEEQALDFYFQSKTYRDLIDETTKLYEKDWMEVYALLRAELHLK